MATIRELLNDLKELRTKPESIGYELRHDLARIILEKLDGKKRTQANLADACRMKPSFLRRVIHFSQNCTFEVAGRIHFALGDRGRLLPSDDPALAMATGEVHYGASQIISADSGEFRPVETR